MFGTALQSCCGSTGWQEGELAEIATLLLETGAIVNLCVEGSPFYSALQAACLRGYSDMTRLLLHHGADVTAVGGTHGTAFMAACSWELTFASIRPEIIQPNVDSAYDIMHLLISAGADVNAQGDSGITALEAICFSHYTPDTKFGMVKILLENGWTAPAGKRTRHKVYVAAKVFSPNIIPLLLQHGIEPSDSESGETSSDDDDEGSGGAPLLSDDGL